MNATVLFLFGLAAGAVGLLILAGSTTALHEIEAFIALVGFAVFMGASGICGDIAALRSDAKKRGHE